VGFLFLLISTSLMVCLLSLPGFWLIV